MDNIVIDTDTPIALTVIDKKTKLAVDISGLAGLLIKVFQVVNGVRVDIDNFSLNAQTGWRAITVVTAAEGKIKIFLNADNLKLGTVGEIIYYELKTIAVNVNFDSGTEERSNERAILAKLVSSELIDKDFV